MWRRSVVVGFAAFLLAAGVVVDALVPPSPCVGSFASLTSNQLYAANAPFDLQNFVYGSYFAHSILQIDDVDSDGIDDVAIGSISASGGNAGQIQIAAVAPGGQGVKPAPFWNLYGEYGINLGVSMANIGDLDGDGGPDLAVGANFFSANTGEIFIVFLSPGCAPCAGNTTITRGLTPFPTGQQTGMSLTAIGGYLAVGFNQGVTFLQLLCSSYQFTCSINMEVNLDTSTNPTLNATSAFIGKAMTNVGDLDGNGLNDMALGIPQFDFQSGGVVVLPFQGGSFDNFNAAQSTSPQTESQFGTSIANIGDVNGDGIPDAAVGAVNYQAPFVGGIAITTGSISGKFTGLQVITNAVPTGMQDLWQQAYLGLSMAAIGGNLWASVQGDVQIGIIFGAGIVTMQFNCPLVPSLAVEEKSARV